MARFELWVEVADRPGNLAALAGDLAACEANIVHLDVHAGSGDTVVDRLVVQIPAHRAPELADVTRRFGGTMRPLHDDAPAAELPEGPVVVRSPVPVLQQARPDPPPAARRTPVTLERLVALADGGLVRLRHLSAGDRPELAAHHARCTAETRRRSRFLASTTDLEAAGNVALAALAGGDIVGCARYELAEAGARADLSVIVEDGHQRRGIGTLLVSELAVLASNAGVTRLRAVAPAPADALVRTLRRSGLDGALRRSGDDLVLDGSLPHGFSASA